MRISDWSSDVCSSDLSQAQVQSLLQQRQAIAAQQSQEEERARQTAFNEVEQAAWPKFVETVPELADPAKGRQVIADIVQYAVAEGLSQEAFRAGVVNSHEMRLLWKEIGRASCRERVWQYV